MGVDDIGCGDEPFLEHSAHHRRVVFSRRGGSGHLRFHAAGLRDFRQVLRQSTQQPIHVGLAALDVLPQTALGSNSLKLPLGQSRSALASTERASIAAPIAPTKTEGPLTMNHSRAGLTPMMPTIMTDSVIGDATIAGLARVRAHHPAP